MSPPGPGQPAPGPRAAVDVGTNSVRLLVIAPDGVRLAREMTITRLGRGVDRTGHLDDDALTRTLDTIRGYHEQWQRLGAGDRVRIAATSAVRDAADRERFFDGVRAITGVDAEVLTGEQEAATSYLGATSQLTDLPAPTVLDIGGGSTEIIVGGAHGVVGAISLQLGCVRLTERLLTGDPPSADEVAAASAEIDRQLATADARLAEQDAEVDGDQPLIGVAGTVTTLAALHLGLDDYRPDAIHGTRVPADVVAALAGRLLAMPAAARRELGPMAPGREDVIAAGALILDRFVTRHGFAAVTASEADILDGLAATPRARAGSR